jgi:hypothetical protein
MTINAFKNKVSVIVSQPVLLRRFRKICQLTNKPCDYIKNENCMKLKKQCCILHIDLHESLTLQDLIIKGTPDA